MNIDTELTKLLQLPFYLSMPVEEAVTFYLQLPLSEPTGRGAKLRRNLRAYWRGLVEERHHLGVALAQQVFWFRTRSVFAILDKLKPLSYNTVETYLSPT